jgi:antitoxin ParD1/3/4
MNPSYWKDVAMNKIDRRTVSLPVEQADYIDRLVASGEYGSASEVVRAGIRALQKHDEVIEHWLQTEVAETYDRMRNDPARGIPLQTVAEKFRKKAIERRKAGD